ncbi:MAG: glycosyltransferase family 39 protein [Acidimicrobiia bacterium]|nr:glycosyltransferase family 39 protein [Acidimicrobiia bacterium]MCY4432945.1 hypothetical protein [bacterium]
MSAVHWDRVALAAVLVSVAVLVGLHVRDHPSLSHIDELQHMDYTLKSPFHVPRHGDTIGTEAMEEAACRGIAYPLRLSIDALNDWLHLTGERGVPLLSPASVVQVQLPPCGSLLLAPDQFPNSGLNTASPHPPVYYTATALGGTVIESAPGVDSPVTGARLVGILWLGAAAIVLWYVLGSLGASIWTKALLIGLLVVSPTVLHESSIINPDTTALLGGALVLGAALRWEAGRAPGWLLPLAALVAVWFKFTNSVAVGAAVVYLAVRAWQQRDSLTRRQVRSWSVVAGAAVILTVASIITWSSVQDARGHISAEQLPTNAIYQVDSFQWDNLGDELFSALTPLRDPFVADTLPRDLLEPLGDLINLLVIAGLGSVALFAAKGSNHRALAGAAAVGMVATGVVTMVASYLTLGIYFDTNPRYGLSLLPFAVAALVPALDNRLIRWSVTAVVLATAGAVLAGVAA